MKVWIAGRRGKALVLRSLENVVEYVLEGNCGKELYKLPLETMIELKGYVTSNKLFVTEYKVVYTPVTERKIDYLKADTWKPREYALYSAWGMRHPRFRYTLLLQHHILRLVREALYRRGFIELLPPMISISSDPGLRGAKKLKTKYYGKDYELTSSVIMYKQLSIAVFEKVFYVARNIREEPAENAETGRHLSEFTQVDVEWSLVGIDRVMKLAEDLLAEVTEKIADKYGWIVEAIGIRKEPVVLKPPFPKITYDEALELASRMGYTVKWGSELSFEAEKAIARYYETPVWIVNFPSISRGFYYLPLEEDPRYNQDFNLVLPEGFGELIDGGAREYRYKELTRRIAGLGEPLEKYSWFLELVKSGAVPPSSGWGMGVERLTAYIAGHQHIVYAAPFPKLPGVTRSP